jgi:predicted transcriptional regulator
LEIEHAATTPALYSTVFFIVWAKIWRKKNISVIKISLSNPPAKLGITQGNLYGVITGTDVIRR